MRRSILFLVLLVPAMVLAQSVRFGVHGNLINSDINAEVKRIAGITPSTGPLQVALDEVYGLGVGGGLHFDIQLGVLSIRISGDYITLSPDKDKFKTYVQQVVPGFPVEFVDGGRLDMISGSANAKLTVLPLPVFKPYITGGGGVTNVRAEDVTLSLSGSRLLPLSILKKQTVGTLNAGVGLDIDLTALTIFAELKANWIMLEEGTSTFVPVVTAGFTF